MNSEENILLFTKNQIFNDSQNEFEQDAESKKNLDSDIVTIFAYDNLLQEYNFETGEVSLYMQRPDELYELLYCSDVEEDFRVSNFYSKNSAFALMVIILVVLIISLIKSREEYNDLLDYTKRNYKNEPLEDSKNIFMRSLLPLASNLGMALNSTRLMENSVPLKNNLKDERLKEYKRLFVKYSCATAYIPISCILENTIKDINAYIASGNLDLDTLKRRLHELECFKQLCPNSYSLISNFINAPYNTHLRDLCDNLQKNMNNIKNLISLYMEDELNIQNRGENDDCK